MAENDHAQEHETGNIYTVTMNLTTSALLVVQDLYTEVTYNMTKNAE